jgi:hypothetical protein
MRRLGVLGLVVAVAVASPVAVFALTQSQLPAKFGLAWGQNAGAPYVRSIPQTSQIGIQNCAASLNDGFPPLTFTPATAGGCPPSGQDFNGILKQLSQWAQWQSAGGPVFYDSVFAASVGGYPNGAILSSAVTPGTQWMSTVDNNTTNPDTSTGNQVVGGTGWVQAPGQVPIGTPMQSFLSSAQTGYVISNVLTIGDASSNATGRANADTQFLFAFLWVNCPNTSCPILTSGGAGSTRGANAAADWAAHKALSTPNMNGGGLVGADSQNGTTSSLLVNVPVTTGSRTVPTSILGENLHALVTGELASHAHSVFLNDPGHSHTQVYSPGGGVNGFVQAPVSGVYVNSPVNTASATTNITIGPASGGGATGNVTATNGSGTAHNTVSRSTVVYWNLKL